VPKPIIPLSPQPDKGGAGIALVGRGAGLLAVAAEAGRGRPAQTATMHPFLPRPDASVPRDRPWLALTVAAGLFLAASAVVQWGLRRWELLQDREWPVGPSPVALTAGQGQWRSGSWTIGLTLAPLPLQSMQRVDLVVRVCQGRRPVTDGDLAVRLKMPAMPAYDLALRLRPRGDGRYGTSLSLPLCTDRPTACVVLVRCDRAGRRLAVAFAFAIEPLAGRRGNALPDRGGRSLATGCRMLTSCCRRGTCRC
jgi:hypothetical protein